MACESKCSKSGGYAVISARTAWFKVYHPQIFWTATLNSVLGKADKQKKYIASAAKDGVKILGPSVNSSELFFKATPTGVQMGLQALRNLGKSANPIIEERKNGPFTGISDLVRRVSPDKSAIESLALAGALDEFGLSRKAIMDSMDDILAFKKDLSKYDSWSDLPEVDEWYSTFVNLSIANCPEMDKKAKLESEYTFSGMYISEHPLDSYAEALKYFNHADISDLVVEKDENEDDEPEMAFEEERKVVVTGILKEVTCRLTKKGDKMAVAQVEDQTGSIKVTVFPKTYKTEYTAFTENALVVIEGTWKSDDYGSQIIVDHVTPIDDMLLPAEGTLFIMVDSADLNSITDTIISKYESNGTGMKLVVRTPEVTRNGRPMCHAFNSKTRTVMSGNKSEVMSSKDVATVTVSFSAFAEIKEMCKNIAILRAVKEES